MRSWALPNAHDVLSGAAGGQRGLIMDDECAKFVMWGRHPHNSSITHTQQLPLSTLNIWLVSVVRSGMLKASTGRHVLQQWQKQSSQSLKKINEHQLAFGTMHVKGDA
eukprot:TRINITY_DN768_c0_g2_i17.p2 TRINITY_DN768_c0_g2~~TRINITY_DN768_c0_g2_i17.p2  ORF type:complete len:108 (-),score=12.95 TRINITY_DN768_c0_g2_i17:1232-1555(-)